MLGHDTYEERHGFMGTLSVPAHCLLFLFGGKNPSRGPRVTTMS